MLTCCHLQPTCHPWPRSPTPKTFDMVMKVAAQTNDSDQHLRALPESGPRSTPQDDCRRMPVPAGKKSCFPDHRLLHGNHGMDPPSFWLQPFGSVSNTSFSMVEPPRKLALHLRCGPSSFPSCLSGKVYLGGSAGATKRK